MADTVLQQRIRELAAHHGSMRVLGRVLEVDHAYLYRLSTGEKTDPGDDLLHKLKLRRVVTYVRTENPHPPGSIAAKHWHASHNQPHHQENHMPKLSMSKAVTDVLAERRRQVELKGWTPEHDDEHDDGSIAQAAACYVEHACSRGWVYQDFEDGPQRYASEAVPFRWPDAWDASWWKPKNPRRDLVRAAALLLAEIERLDRAPAPGVPVTKGGSDAA